MARPKKEGMDYFPHDTDASSDEKIEALRLLYGNDGYAFYFILLERIYRTNDAELDVSDAETMQILARKVAVTQEKFDSMLETSLKRGCFDRNAYDERQVLTSEGIKKRSAPVVDKRLKTREKYYQTKDEVSDAETKQKQHHSAHKEKKRKEKERKEYNTSVSSEKPKHKYNDDHMQLAQLLYNRIKINNPKKKEPNYGNWANVFRLMMEQDGYEAKEIQDLIVFAQNHEFWNGVVLSAESVRKNKDQLYMQMQQDHKKYDNVRPIRPQSGLHGDNAPQLTKEEHDEEYRKFMEAMNSEKNE